MAILRAYFEGSFGEAGEAGRACVQHGTLFSLLQQCTLVELIYEQGSGDTVLVLRKLPV